MSSSMADHQKGADLRLRTLEDKKSVMVVLHESHDGRRVQRQCLTLGSRMEKLSV